jgi:predicted nucleotidyltransferase
MLEEKWKKLIKEIVRKYLPDKDYKIFIFGSRAEGKNRKFSDIDLGIEGPEKISSLIHLNIEEDLENSDIPYRVDVVDFKTVSPDFAKIAKKKILNL